MIDKLAERVKKAYADKTSAFFEKVKSMNLTDAEFNAVPSLFIPGWGEDYDSSFPRIVVAGKETLSWANEYGDSLKHDIDAFQRGGYDVLVSCRRYREEGPSDWQNRFWRYPVAALAKIFDWFSKADILVKDNPVLRSIGWFNGHAVETWCSQGIDKNGISVEKLNELQKLSDECGLSDFATFIDTFSPDVILYLYRNNSGIPNRCFPEEAQFIRYWGRDGLVSEWWIGRTIVLQSPHPTNMSYKVPMEEYASTIAEIFKARMVQGLLADTGVMHDFYEMKAPLWAAWVDFVRNEAAKYEGEGNMELSRHLMAVVAKELVKRGSTMTAQTLVLLLNEVDQFRKSGWQYSKERRGPYRSIGAAWRYYQSVGREVEAKYIAVAFTKRDGSHAWE